MNNLLYLIVLLSLMGSCANNKVIKPTEFKGDQLIFSHGGGFAGTYKTFCLLDNGQLFKGEDESIPNEEVNSLSSAAVKQIFSNYDILNLGKMNVESYGNLNYSIRMIKEGKEHKLVWEKGQKGAEQLQLFYRNVMNQIRINNDKNKKLDSM